METPVNMNDTRTKKRDKRQYIKVFVRIRPINNAERNGQIAVIPDKSSTQDLIIQENSHEKCSKRFTFDRVFGPSSKQTDVYNEVVNPLLEEVLAGYNCTVFAYGQTGTGKTFTMEGISTDTTLNWQSDTTAGIIPRSLSHLFHELQLLDAHEYTVRVSFLALYNEELFDLLSPNNNPSKIRLYEDSSKKGAVIVHGLEEVTVWSKNDVYKILERGLEKKRTAATLMNAHSSRSHTIFSITIHMKEAAFEGDELLKIGKLNLVDLAGSENIGRSGAVDQRAREAGSINQSLLTLGRVITALVERAPHVPYRESKLTRLLQESLGGRTKTSIIATVSPASINLEETLSTLDYAHRARNITIRPELNQKLSKKLILKEYAEEIEKLRRDLVLTREKNGIYLAHDNYIGMQELLNQQRKELVEKLKRIKVLEESLQNNERIFNELSLEHDTQTDELHKTKNELSNVTHALQTTKHQLKLTEHNREEQKHLMEKHVSTEKLLLSQAHALLNTADAATVDIDKLHDKIARKTQVEEKNESVGKEFRQSIEERLQEIKKDLSTYKEKLQEFCISTKDDVDTQMTVKRESLDNAILRISMNLTKQYLTETDNLKTDINSCYKDYQSRIHNEMKHATSILERETKSLDAISEKFMPIILNFAKNEIGMNLQLLKDSMSHKFDNVSAYVKHTVNLNCKRRLEDCDNICKLFEEIKRHVDNLLLCRYGVIQKRRMFTKLMENGFNSLSLLTKSEEESYAVLTSKLNGITENCKSLRVETTDSCNTNINLSRRLETKIQSDLEGIKNNVAASNKQTEETENILEQCHSVINELKLFTTARSNDLREHKDFVEHDAEDMGRMMHKDNREIVSSINDINKIVTDANSNHVQVMEEQKANTSRIAEEINNRLESQLKEVANYHNKVTENSQILEDRVNKFLDEDMKRDLPTGTTPIRKQFSYPRQFNVTSPHERILQRFREARNVIETSEYDDDTLMSDEITMTELVNSTVLSESNHKFWHENRKKKNF